MINQFICRQFGFKHMLINLVEAPEAVLSYFCTYYRLHDVPVADEAQVARFVDAHHSIQRFYTGDQVVIIIIIIIINITYCIVFCNKESI